MFGCNYCDYMFSVEDISTHHTKTHRILAKSITFSPEEYYQTKLQLFSTAADKSKFKCELCVKMLKTGKLINHIKYFHNFSNFFLIDSFTTTALNLNFNDNTLTLKSKENSPTDCSSTKCIILRMSTAVPNAMLFMLTVGLTYYFSTAC